MPALVKLLCISLVCLLWGTVGAQGTGDELQYYGISDGLSHNQVLSTFQDSRGMMWLLAKDQLNRFDGRVFTPMPSTYLKYSAFGKIIFEDDEGDLWIWQDQAPSTLLFFNIHTEQVRTYAEKFAGTALATEQPFQAVIPTRVGAQLLLPDATVVTWDGVAVDTIGQLPQARWYRGISETADGQSWWRLMIDEGEHDQQLVLLDPDGSIRLESQIGNAITGQQLGPNGEVWLTNGYHLQRRTSSGGVHAYPLSQDLPIRSEIPEVTHHHFSYDAQRQRIWYQSRDHLWSVDPDGKVSRDYTAQYPQLRVAMTNELRLVANGDVWLSTIEGSFRIKSPRKAFQRLLWKAANQVATGDMISCRGIAVGPTGRIVVAGRRYLHHIQGQRVDTIDQLAVYNYLSVSRTADGTYWAGAPDTLVRWHPQRGIQKQSIGRGRITAAYHGLDTSWLGVGENPDHFLATFSSATGTFTPHPVPGFSGQRVRVFHIQADQPDTLWLLTNLGLMAFRPEEGMVRHLHLEASAGDQFPANHLTHACVDAAGVWWIASRRGMIRWVPHEGQTRLYTTEDGLSHNNIYAIYEDDYGHLWLSSDFGIMQFDKATEQVLAYLPNDGITHAEFNTFSHHQAADGRIFFGSLNGVTVLDPKQFKDAFSQSYDTPFILLQGKVTAKDGATHDALPRIRVGERVSLVGPQAALHLQFALLEYDHNALVRYTCRIEGRSADWETTTNNTLRITGLPYGRYVVHLKAQTARGPFATDELRIAIKVVRPWYFSYLAYAVYTVAALLLVYVWLVWRTQRLKNQNAVLERQVAQRTMIISEQKEKLEALDRAKSRFFTNVAHELRTPLTLIQGPLQSMIRGKVPEPQQPFLLEKAHQSSQQLLQLVEEIMELTRLETGQLETHPVPVLLYPFMQQRYAQFHSLGHIQQQYLQLDYRLPEDTVLLLDQPKVEKILNNLLVNAHKFTPSGGAIRLTVEREGDFLRFAVADEGSGIPVADIDQIFNRYYQATHHRGHAGGTGIGLALCFELCKIMGGQISVESELGKGSTFTVCLPWKVGPVVPLASTLPQPQPKLQPLAVHTPMPETCPSEQLTTEILLVEDHPALREYLSFLLQPHYKLALAENGREALNYLTVTAREEPDRLPSLVVTDLMMPMMDGYALIEEMKSRPLLQTIPLLVLTARAERSARLRALRISVDDYLIKPFDEEELLVRIQNLLRHARQRKAAPDLSLALAEATTDQAPTIAATGEDWLAAVEAACLARLGGPAFTLDEVANDLCLSRSSFFRRLKAATGLSPTKYLRELRLQRARELLENKAVDSAKAAAQRVGFQKYSYFAQLYRERFGKLPGEVLR